MAQIWNTIKQWMLVCLVLVLAQPAWAQMATPLATDSRIRTYIYSPNEVFRLTTEYGYQSNIEFGMGEQIRTISVGDTVAFKLTPTGNRLFVRAMQNDALTNMTVITDKRAYQFELSSIILQDQDITYVVRFFFPEEDLDARRSDIQIKEFSSARLNLHGGAAGMVAGNAYRITGTASLRPEKAYSNGASTFLQMPKGLALKPRVMTVSAQGVETPVSAVKQGDYLVVDGVQERLALRYGNDVICVVKQPVIAEGS